MPLNTVALELKDAYDKHKKTNLTFFTSYLIDISKQTSQEFHESLMCFTKLFFNKLDDVEFNISLSNVSLFKTILKSVLCDKYTITSKLEEKVIFSLISYCELKDTPNHTFDIDAIFENADEYIKNNGKFAKEVEATIIKIVEKHI